MYFGAGAKIVKSAIVNNLSQSIEKQWLIQYYYFLPRI